MRTSKVSVLVFAFLVVGCDANVPQAPKKVSPPATAKKEVPSTSLGTSGSESRVQFDLGELGLTIAKEKCKGMGIVKKEPAKDSYDPKKPDEIEIVTCPGVEIVTYLAHYYSPPNEIPLQLTLRTHDSRIPTLHSIGARAEEVIQALGPPVPRKDGNLEYQTDIEGLDNNHVLFLIESGLVKEILWSWYLP